MRIHIIAVGNRMPTWARQAYLEYAKRMPSYCSFQLHEISAAKRRKGLDIKQVLSDECSRIRSSVPKGCQLIALTRTGRRVDTKQLATALESWLSQGKDTAILIGGPDGLDEACIKASSDQWSLSALTLAHRLVLVLLAEQLYRAWTIVDGHPYHR